VVRETFGSADVRDHVRIAHNYNAAGLRTVTVAPNDNNVQWRYDARDQISHAIHGAGVGESIETFARDKDGRVIEHRSAEGRTTRTTYDAFGRVVAVTDALGHVTRTSYDAGGRPTVVRVFERQPGVYGVRAAHAHGDGLRRTGARGARDRIAVRDAARGRDRGRAADRVRSSGGRRRGRDPDVLRRGWTRGEGGGSAGQRRDHRVRRGRARRARERSNGQRGPHDVRRARQRGARGSRRSGVRPDRRGRRPGGVHLDRRVRRARPQGAAGRRARQRDAVRVRQPRPPGAHDRSARQRDHARLRRLRQPDRGANPAHGDRRGWRHRTRRARGAPRVRSGGGDEGAHRRARQAHRVPPRQVGPRGRRGAARRRAPGDAVRPRLAGDRGARRPRRGGAHAVRRAGAAGADDHRRGRGRRRRDHRRQPADRPRLRRARPRPHCLQRGLQRGGDLRLAGPRARRVDHAPRDRHDAHRGAAVRRSPAAGPGSRIPVAASSRTPTTRPGDCARSSTPPTAWATQAPPGSCAPSRATRTPARASARPHSRTAPRQPGGTTPAAA
jgi:YD repeat-containing protein